MPSSSESKLPARPRILTCQLRREGDHIDPDEATKEAIGDWHYWVSQGYRL
jgi:hypothetical protein